MSDTDEELATLRLLVSQESPTEDDKPAVTGWLQRMCRVAARDLLAAGVGVSLLSDSGDLMTAAASDDRCTAVEDLQFALGEGPCLAAYATRAPVLVPDLEVMERTSWPGYARAAREYGVRAVFAFPLQIGSTRLGAMDVYRGGEGSLSRTATSRAHSFAALAVEGLLDAGSTPEGASALLHDSPGSRYEVYQAQGMLMVQLGVSGETALARLRAHAFAHGLRLTEVARAVLDRTLHLERDDP